MCLGVCYTAVGYFAVQNWSSLYPSANLKLKYSFLSDSPARVRTASFLKFLDHTQWHTTVGRTPLDEGSARPKHVYLTIYKVVQIWPEQTVTCLHTNSHGHIWTTLYNTHKRRTCVMPGGGIFFNFCILLYSVCNFIRTWLCVLIFMHFAVFLLLQHTT
jgi:hypothetical protein